MTVLVGDIHSDVIHLSRICNKYSREWVIGIGDIDIGSAILGDTPKFADNFKFFRGNHDNPHFARTHSQYLGEFGQFYDHFFFISGGKSVDKEYRLQNDMAWWEEEELTSDQLQEALELYSKIKPQVVLSHDLPWQFHQELKDKCVKENPYLKKYGDPVPYPGPVMMDQMLAVHKPTLWVGGHWHTSWKKDHEGTRFICLDRMENLVVENELKILLKKR